MAAVVSTTYSPSWYATLYQIQSVPAAARKGASRRAKASVPRA